MEAARSDAGPRRRAARALLCAALAAAALLAAGGHAAAADTPPASVRYAAGSPGLAAAEQIADRYWGTTPCGGQVDVEWGVDDPSINARSYWSNPVSTYGDPQENTQCRLVLNGAIDFSWQKLCTVVVHEFGHLTGHPHSPDGTGVMSAIYHGPVDACVAAPDPAASPSAASAPSRNAPARRAQRRAHRARAASRGRAARRA